MESGCRANILVPKVVSSDYKLANQVAMAPLKRLIWDLEFLTSRCMPSRRYYSERSRPRVMVKNARK